MKKQTAQMSSEGNPPPKLLSQKIQMFEVSKLCGSSCVWPIAAFLLAGAMILLIITIEIAPANPTSVPRALKPAPHPSSAPSTSAVASAIPSPNPSIIPSWCRSPRGNSITNNVSSSVHNCQLEQRSDVPPFTRREQSKRPRFAILTLSSKTNRQSPSAAGVKTDDFYEQIRRMSFSNKLSYCERHGYDLIVEDESVGVRNGNIMFSKLLAVEKWLPHYEWIVWLDHDALIVNMSAKIEDVVDKRIPYLQHAFSLLSRSKKIRSELFWRRTTRRKKHNINQVNLNRKKNEKKQIHFYSLADPIGGLNSGVLFVRNSSWSLDFFRRLSKIPGKLAGGNDQGTFYELLHLSAQKQHEYKWQTNETQVELDRLHSWVDLDSTWNAYWLGIAWTTKHLGGIIHDWMYSDALDDISARKNNMTLTPLFRQRLGYWSSETAYSKWRKRQRLPAPPPSVVVHFVGCKAFPQCLPWMRYTFEKAHTLFAAPEVMRGVEVPFRYLPPPE